MFLQLTGFYDIIHVNKKEFSMNDIIEKNQQLTKQLFEGVLKKSKIKAEAAMDAGAFPNSVFKDYLNFTPYLLAVNTGQKDIIKFLVESGADPKAKLIGDKNAFDIAKEMLGEPGYPTDMIQFLENLIKQYELDHELFKSAYSNDKNKVVAALEKGGNPNVQFGNLRETALGVVIKPEIGEILYGAGADINLKHHRRYLFGNNWLKATYPRMSAFYDDLKKKDDMRKATKTLGEKTKTLNKTKFSGNEKV